MNSRVGVVLAIALLVGSLPGSVGAIGGGPGLDRSAAEPTIGSIDAGAASAAAASGTTDHDADVLHRTTVLRHLPDRRGEFEAEMTFAVPDRLTELEIELEPEATVAATGGFEATGDGTYRWTEETDDPTIRFTMPADRTDDVGHQHAASEYGSPTIAREPASAETRDSRAGHRSGHGYTFVGTGEWAVVQVPGVGISMRYTGSSPIGIDETVAVDGPGATGGDIAYFGPVTEYERASERERFRLVVPEAAALAAAPDEILDALVDASDRFDVGASREEVFVVAVPADDVEWAARGIQYGESDAWVVADAPLSEASPVWFHEYVHARQAFANPDIGTERETAWLVEAQAEYYAALLAFEGGLTDFHEFEDALEAGERSPHADAALADPATWESDRTAYVKGPLVYGELDRRVRFATDGDRTMADVLRTLNGNDGAVTEEDFLAAVEAEGGTEVRAVAEEYTRTDRTPEMWSRSAHEDAFDRAVARFAYGLDPASIEIGGEPRGSSGTTADGRPVIAVPAGESVTVPVTVENAGDRDGTADATVTVDGSVVDHRRLELGVGERTTERLSWTPRRPGTYDVRVGSDRVTAYVRSAASVTVTDLRVDPERAAPGETVTVTATVAAVDDRPGAAVLAFRTADGVVAEESVVVRPGETETVAATLAFDEVGRYEIAVADRSTAVAIENGPAEALERIDDVPGFGPAAALAALAIAVGLARFARRR
ncbi:CARDB domain-containing protein [Halosolutus gelatinilyticus]|uniref:CARDB domain-containing protein n=1 Tax=Halosolutus gelatinilyticus TaxID=2931975 RepID=UPI001FF27085|nr:CARDB domain-containing protein [Halosolutus gelatinilyticus]